MPEYVSSLGQTRYRFADLRDLLAKASPLRSGDQLAGIAAASDEERVAARFALADLPLTAFCNDVLVAYELDEVTRLIIDDNNARAFGAVRAMTVGGFRDWLLSDEADGVALAKLAPGLMPEMVAAVSKLMRNQDLIVVAAKCEVITRFRTTIGGKGRLASRLQPNHPTDSATGIAGSTLDGLLFGIGDAVIGVNPASDSVDACITLLDMFENLRLRFAIPMQSCVLAHISATMAAIERGAPVDLVFQSIAGTQGTNTSFGVSLATLQEASDAAASLARGTVGSNAMYFETGQGSALSAGADHGVDQQTLEVRAYAVARKFAPFLVNTVVGFIGPEYLYDAKQIIRAGLEDHFCGKLLGLPMGVDVCYTNHAEADQDDMDNLMFLLAAAGTNFLIAVPGADDVMLNYQSLSYHDVASLRKHLGLRPAPEFEDWLSDIGIYQPGGALAAPHAAQHAFRQRLLAR